ncbi:MAG: hypothetical protein ACRD19_05160 [Terriglobia bacterium]
MTEPVSQESQRALVDRLMSACGGNYLPEVRRKFFISGPQWAAAYQGQALFHAPTRSPVQPAEVIERLAEIGIGWWTTHDTDIIPTDQLMTDRQDGILEGIEAERGEVLHGHWRNLLSSGLGRKPRRRAIGGSRLC